MAALHTLSRRLQMVALLAILVAFDAVAVAAAYVLAHVAAGVAPIIINQWDHLFWSLSFDFVPLWPVVLVGTPVVLVCQSVFGYRLSLREAHGDVRTGTRPEPMSDSPDAVEHRDVTAQLEQRVNRLAQIATMTPPSVTVVDSTTPNSYVIGRPGDSTLVATTALREHLTDDELDAVLSHELAHLKHGDAFVMTAAAFLPTVSRRFLTALAGQIRNSFICQWFFDDDTDDEATDGNDSSGFFKSYGQAAIALFLFALVAIPITAALYVASTACYRLLSRIREYAADAGGVAICGSPAALASALEELTANPRPNADLRREAVSVRELCVVPRPIDAQESTTPANRAERITRYWTSLTERVLPDSHPSTSTRIEALQHRESTADWDKTQ